MGSRHYYKLRWERTFEETTPYLLQGIGEGGNPHTSEAFKEADVVLLAGVSWWPEGYVPEKARIIQIDTHIESASSGIPVEIAIKGKTEQVIPLLQKLLPGMNRIPNGLIVSNK